MKSIVLKLNPSRILFRSTVNLFKGKWSLPGVQPWNIAFAGAFVAWLTIITVIVIYLYF